MLRQDKVGETVATVRWIMVNASTISTTILLVGRHFCLRRLCALLTLAAFTAGLFGLPTNVQFRPFGDARGNVDLSGGTQEKASSAALSADQLAVRDTPMGSCYCPSTVQAADQCCCSKGSSVIVRPQSCCSDRKDSSATVPDGNRKQPTEGTWLSCPCGTLSGSLLFSCGEPRLLNSGTAVQTLPAWNDTVEFASLQLPFRNLSPETPHPRQLGC